MKIEVAESLLYSWMRHVKECKIVQTNWKVSSKWGFIHRDDIERYNSEIIDAFRKFSLNLFENITSIDQLVHQGECDVIGIDFTDGKQMVYAAEVAFHRGGLNYGNNRQKVVEKLVRAAFCIYGYTGLKDADIIFACPKISQHQKDDIEKYVKVIQGIFDGWGFSYTFRFIAKEDFRDVILEPVRLASSDVEDTGELFMRSLQLLDMDYVLSYREEKKNASNAKQSKPSTILDKTLAEFKVGKLAQLYFSKFAKEGLISEEEVNNLLDEAYSKEHLGLNYPCLVLERTEDDRVRYYSSPIKINKQDYYLCSQWYETPSNNDRPLLKKWIQDHSR